MKKRLRNEMEALRSTALKKSISPYTVKGDILPFNEEQVLEEVG